MKSGAATIQLPAPTADEEWANKQSRKSNWVFQVVPFRARGGVSHRSLVFY